jgi:DNA-binding NarL/FixJ family response regulator
VPHRILIADDYDLMRESLKTALEGEGDWRVCAEAKDGLEAVQLALELLPDAIILDFTMPALDGIRAARRILSVLPHIPILLYTNHASSRLVIEATQAGVRQVVGKAVPINQLVEALECALNGQPGKAGEIPVAAMAKAAAGAANTCAPAPAEAPKPRRVPRAPSGS